jgi:hypothetical protein
MLAEASFDRWIERRCAASYECEQKRVKHHQKMKPATEVTGSRGQVVGSADRSVCVSRGTGPLCSTGSEIARCVPIFTACGASSATPLPLLAQRKVRADSFQAIARVQQARLAHQFVVRVPESQFAKHTAGSILWMVACEEGFCRE